MPKPKVYIDCEHCGETFVRYRTTNKYCSNACQKKGFSKNREYASGKEHWNWKGGITEELILIRRSLQYRDWRMAVYKRDSYTCQLCDKKLRAKDIVAHHIKGFSEYECLRFNVKNGITLCRACHLNYHKGRVDPALWEAVKNKLNK